MGRREYVKYGTVKADNLFVAGAPVQSGYGIFGDSFFVDYRNGSDGVSGKNRNRPVKTLGAAVNSAQSNNNDRIFIDGDSTVIETAMLSITKNRLHFFGDGGPSFPRGVGCAAKVQIGVTTDTDDIALLLNTGVRNSFSNIKFISTNTLTQAVYTVAEGGEYTRYFGCEIYKPTHLTAATGGNRAAELLCNGDTAQFYGCQFGDLVNARGTGGSCVRPTVLFTRETITGKVARECLFEDCTFLVNAAVTGIGLLNITGATDIERMLRLVRPHFINAHLAVADPADAVLIEAAQTQAKVLIIEPVNQDCSAHATASAGAYVFGGSTPLDTTTGIAAIIDS
jgi:hypothetical protein